MRMVVRMRMRIRMTTRAEAEKQSSDADEKSGLCDIGKQCRFVVIGTFDFTTFIIE